MAKSVIEAICKDKGITSGTLAKKIENLADTTNMSPMVKAQADEIRFFGNEMAHGDYTQTISRDDAKDVLELMDIIIDYVYQQPAKLEAIRKRRAQRIT